jgi:hypothetical protein
MAGIPRTVLSDLENPHVADLSDMLTSTEHL